jgi:RimJ/RimL family protein N-acetyltransferase
MPLPPRQISKATLERLPDGRAPERAALEGKTVRLEPLDAQQHTADLYTNTHSDSAGEQVWDYLPYGPWASARAMASWVAERAVSKDPLFFAVRDLASGQAAGVVTFMEIQPAHGTIEIGHIWFAPILQNTRQSTEALFLLMQHAFENLHYRRLEWKCDAANQPSRNAAVRLGFDFEGIFYQHRIVKGKNRDTAWFSIMDHEWRAIQANYEAWLADGNFDASGRAATSLGDANRQLRVTTPP